MKVRFGECTICVKILMHPVFVHYGSARLFKCSKKMSHGHAKKRPTIAKEKKRCILISLEWPRSDPAWPWASSTWPQRCQSPAEREIASVKFVQILATFTRTQLATMSAPLQTALFFHFSPVNEDGKRGKKWWELSSTLGNDTLNGGAIVHPSS